MFQDILKKHIPNEKYVHFENALSQLINSYSTNKLLEIFSRVYQWNYDTKIREEDIKKLKSTTPYIEFSYWSLEDFLRAAIFEKISNVEQYQYVEAFRKSYRIADTKEQCSLLKILATTKYKVNFLPLALDAIRTNIPDVLAALACGNPYPCEFFTLQEFNNMVLKAVFMNISVATIYGIKQKNNSELSRMVNQYIDEREAANRDFPHELWLIVTPFSNEKEKQRIYKYLQHSSADHRYWVARALLLEKQPQYSLIKQQIEIEKNQEIKDVLQQVIGDNK
ncbi:EboA domain-containing protein [Candidatus Uabimicrobium sp. HlEnr_7]|uniref:EboA domain-containing protein n=1 Tax=Candidatus Uabimicrobium helgolandensis TaxID=3095367 RepID=UPI0035575599